ncbi:Type II secretion system protein D precursor [Symmachiella dynata]|nr:Type II secretion system protein D precursor [Symmachiella dynata]
MPIRFRSRGLICTSLFALLLAASAPITAEDALPIANHMIHHVDRPFTKLEMVEKSTRILELKGRITTVDVNDSEVITASKVENPFNPRQLRITAGAPGVTDVTVVDEFGQSHKLEILVVGDVRHLQSLLQLSFPDAAIHVTKVQNTAVLSGWVDQPAQIRPIMQLTEQFFPEPINNIQVGGVQQVTLKVKVMEVQRGKIRRLGFNFFDIGNNGYIISNPGNLIPIRTLTSAAGAATSLDFNPAGATAMFGIISDSNIFQGFIEALKEESLLKILAEPNLSVKSGSKANLLQGGEFPILIPQSLGTLSVEFKSFGVKLEALPIVLGNGRLSLQLIPEVSERDFSSAIETQGIVVPGLTTRRVQTAVEMDFGQTFVIAGLIFDRQTATTFKVPVLGELPFFGALFRRVRYDETETELLIMVTPELADPLKPCEVPPQGPGQFTSTPTDRELYLDGTLEVPYYGPQCVDCEADGGYVPQPAYIEPTPNGNMQYAPSTVPPAPAASGSDISPPPTPQPEAAKPQGVGPTLGHSPAKPDLVTPRFRSAAPRVQQASVAPSGATPLLGPAPTKRVKPVQSTTVRAKATTKVTTAPRAKTLNQTRPNRRTGPTQVVQQQRTGQNNTTIVRRASAASAQPSGTAPTTAAPANPALVFPDAEKQKLLNQLKASSQAKPSRRAPRPGLIAPKELTGRANPDGQSSSGTP